MAEVQRTGLLFCQRLDKRDQTLMGVTDPLAGQPAIAHRLQVDVSNIGLEGKQVKHPFPRVELQSSHAIRVDPAGPCIAVFVVVSIVGKEQREGDRIVSIPWANLESMIYEGGSYFS